MDNATRLAIFQADHAGDTATLRRYATAADPATRLGVARAEHTPPSALRAILGAPGPRGPVASGTAAYVAAAEHEVALAEHGLARRLALARLPEAQPAGLVALAADPDLEVRAAVAAHPQTPPATLHELLRAGGGEIWLAMATNPSLPEDLAVDLVTERWEYEDAIEYSAAVQERVASNPGAPLAAMQALLDECQRNYEAMTALASNPGMPLDLLTKLLDVAPRNEGAEVARTRIADLATAEPAVGLDL